VEASVDGRAVAVGAGKPRALLAMLALNAGSTVSSDRLIDGLWGDPPPASAAKLVQVHVSQLRKALTAAGDGANILTRGHGYELRLGPDELDVTRFERLVAGGRPREALALWRGPPLDDVAGEPFAAAEIRRLDELRLAALELAIDRDLEAGRHREVTGELEALVLDEPLRERLHAQRMLALYRAGRQADALEAYRQARAALVEEVGVEPGPELRRLHEAILRQDASLELGGSDAARQPARAVDEEARADAVRRVGDAASRIAGERRSLRSAEDDLASGIVELAARREQAVPLGSEAVVVCPFKGLASFETEDAEFFFGRERLVGELVARLTGAPLTGIVGPSGSGKSSVLKAGLLPALSAGVLPGSERWPIALLRPGQRPVRELDQALVGVEPAGRQIVAVDQFEELFTACRDEGERAAFADGLVACARDPRRRALVLVAIRADFYGRCAAYPELSRLLGANHVLVGPMRRDELRRAIELPAQRAGLSVDPELIDALLDDVEGEPGALPLLSTALLELWQHRDGRRLRVGAYERAGGVHAAVARLAERTNDRLDPEGRHVARRILLRLAGEGEGDAVVRRRVPLAELEGEPGGGVTGVLSALADDRLVTIGAGEVEVAHEALLREWPRLREWLDEDAEGRRLHRHVIGAAGEWHAVGRDPGELYRGARLAAALEWSDGHSDELNATEREYLAASKAASESSHRRLRALLAGLAALLALAVVAGIVALEQRGNARTEATSAVAQRLGARALLENDLDRSLLLARQGVALDDTPQTRGNLLAALVKSPAAIGVMRGDGDGIETVALSPDELTLAAGDPSGNVFLFDTRTRRRLASFRPVAGYSFITQLAFSPDGRRLAVAHDSSRGNLVTVFDSRSHAPLVKITPPAHRYVASLSYSADGTTLDASSNAFDGVGPAVLVRYDAGSGRRMLGPEPINDGDWSPALPLSDGTRLVTAGKGAVTVRDAATLRTSERFAVGGLASPAPAAYSLSPDDRTLAIGDESGAVRFLDLRTGAVRSASDRHSRPVTATLFAPDGRSLISTSEDGDAIVWDVEQRAAVETLSGHGAGINRAQLTSDGQTLYTASHDGTVFVWDLGGSRRLGRRFTAGAGGGFNVSQSSDGRLFATGQEDGSLSIVDAETLKARATFPVGGANKVRFVPGSHAVVVVGNGGFAALVDADTGQQIRRLGGHGREDLNLPGISANGRLLSTSSSDGVVRFWSLPDGDPRGMLRFDREIFSSQLSPDGRWLSVSLVDEDFSHGDVEIWDVRRRRREHRLPITEGPATTRFSPDSRLVTAAGHTGWARVWSTGDGQPVTRLLEGDASGIQAAEISPDGRTLVTGNEAGAVRLWDIETQQSLGAPLPGTAGLPVVPQFTRDGTALVAAYANGDAYRWDIRPESLVRQACAVAGRRLTRAEWEEFLPGRAYAPAC
jgi:WD40 repeat protein/DNA-binding SARP family transcriptional activator